MENINPKRIRTEKRLKFFTTAAVWVAVAMLAVLFATIISRGHSAFTETRLVLDITFSEEVLEEKSYRTTLNKSLYSLLGVSTRVDKKKARVFLSQGAPEDLAAFVADETPASGSTHKVSVRAKGVIDDIIKGRMNITDARSLKLFSQQQRDWFLELKAQGRINTVFNRTLFTAGDSSEAETAGIGVALLGSAWMLIVVVLLAVPIGVAAALYMEFFAPPSLLTHWIDAAIKNLAAVPSIVFGILGLAIFINIVGLPRSAPLVGGIVLALMTLPTVIIAARAALAAIPPSLLEAAMAMGASKMQGLFHHVLPSAAPGIITAVIIGLAQALGETAPLLMIGMVAFIIDYPTTVTEPASALPVQIYMWSGMAERGFAARAAAAIMVLLAFLISINGFAVWLRQRMEKKW